VRAGDVPRAVRLVRNTSRAVATAARILEGEGVRLRAMALTYISLFALVPALVVVFSVVQAFTGTERIAEALHRFLFENLAVGAGDTVEPYLGRFISNAHATSAGLVGGLFLVWSSVTLFSNVDRAVNETWGIHRRRSVTQQVVIYWMGLTLGPLLLASSITVAGIARTWLANTDLRFLAVAAGVLLTCTFFALLYAIVPFTRVRALPAIGGGLVAGVAWEVAKWGYALLVAKIFRYHAIYGSVAAVPIFIFWLFVSWSILLFGARLAYVFQHAAALVAGTPHPASRGGREVLAGQVMLRISRAFDRGDPAPDPSEVSSQLGADADDVAEVLGVLRAQGLVMSLGDGGLVPARSLERISLDDVRRAVLGGDLPSGRGTVASIVRAVEEQASGQLAEVTFRELCDRERAGGVPPAPDSAAAGATP
jgi:membrane protein